jgi:hypothetical protein
VVRQEILTEKKLDCHISCNNCYEIVCAVVEEY